MNKGRGLQPPELLKSSSSGGFFISAAKYFALVLLAAAALSAAPVPPQIFVGKVTDDVCPNANHSAMQMGPTDTACALACIDIHGAALVLYDGKQTYGLSDQAKPQKFAGMKVKVTGTLDPKTKMIQVTSVAAAK